MDTRKEQLVDFKFREHDIEIQHLKNKTKNMQNLDQIQTDVNNINQTLNNADIPQIKSDLTAINTNIGSNNISNMKSNIDNISLTLNNANIPQIKNDINQIKNNIGNNNIQTMKNDIDDLKDEITNLDSIQDTLQDHDTRLTTLENQTPSGDNPSTPSPSSSEEKLTLLSYDILKVRDNTHRDNLWEPNPVFFTCQAGSKVRLHILFDIIHTFTTPVTTTTTIKLDDTIILNSVKNYTTTGNENIDFTHIFTSNTNYHKLLIKIQNNYETSTSSCYSKPEYFTVELFGTNVQFISRHNDFTVVPYNNTQVLMTTTVYDNKPRLSVQTADSNLTLDYSRFNVCLLSKYRFFNYITPYPYYKITNNIPTFNTSPSLLFATYAQLSDIKRIGFKANAPISESTNVGQDNIVPLGSYIAKPTILNGALGDYQQNNFVSITNDNIVYYFRNNSGKIQFTNPAGAYCADCSGVLRIGNFYTYPVPIIITRADGTSFIFIGQEVEANIKTTELGFGTHINAYLLDDGYVHVYMRVGNNVKHLTLELDTQTQIYNVINTQIIENCHEYWLAPNGSHFERFGNKISYFPQNSLTPSATNYVFF